MPGYVAPRNPHGQPTGGFEPNSSYPTPPVTAAGSHRSHRSVDSFGSWSGGLCTAEDHEEFCSDEYLTREFEMKGVEEGSDLYWKMRKDRAQEAVDVICRSIERGNRLAAGDPTRTVQPMMTEGGLSGESSVEGSVGTKSGRSSECDVNMRGGDFKYLYKDLVGDGRGKERVWKWRRLHVVDTEEGVEGRTGGRLDASHGEASVSKRLSVSAGKGVVEEEGFEVISATGPAATNGRECKKFSHPLFFGSSENHQQGQDIDLAITSSNKGNKRKRLRRFFAGFLPRSSTKSSSAGAQGNRISDMENRPDESRRRLSSSCPPIPPARGSSSRAEGSKTSVLSPGDRSPADNENQARSSTEDASQTSSWSAADGDSDIVKTNTNTSDTSVADTSDDDNNTAETNPVTASMDDDHINTTLAQTLASSMTITKDEAPSSNEASNSNQTDTTTAEQEQSEEVIDYASMIAEAGDYFFDPFGTESREKGKGIDRSVTPPYLYHDMYHLCPPLEIPECPYPPPDNEDGTPWYVRSEKDEEERRELWNNRPQWARDIVEQVRREREEADRWRHEQRVRDRLPPLDLRGLPPVPEKRRHRVGQGAAAMSSEDWGFAGRGGEGVGTRRMGVPDIFGGGGGGGSGSDRRTTTFVGGASGRDNRSLSYAEVMINARRNEAAQAGAAAAVAAMQRRKKRRFALTALPEIPRGFGRLMGRVIGHNGGHENSEVVEEREEEEGVVEEEEDVGRGERVVRGSEENEDGIFSRSVRPWV
ncbi:hypothetical protein QC762_211960 [Podospora pseudocomata]|uniref:Rrn9 domain-containing protein n=1 Tax=Podospora pseudocomata TaxID=2093779 RepID=A0ABR0GNH7_9PEZI|nr:hypothetical protein QC762_211960 [Podospora pseudocomata]